MNFKNEYQKDFDKVKLSDDFKANLADELEGKSFTKKKNTIYLYGSVLAAVAVLAIVVGVWLRNGTSNSDKNTTESNTQVGVQVQGNTTSGSFNGSIDNTKWYKSATTDEEKYQVFVELIKGGTLETLYCSEATTFTKENILAGADATAIMNQLIKASESDEQLSGNVKNYMAVFSGGEIIKFTISNNGHVKLNDLSVMYKY